ncbi:galactosylceramide sulfotransferase-like [Ptychodera flava]|uniref:galactosylceramide sulfotransferase-like n=1 Tax=Ptychodera flava TaxID=63121 RepID=UPI00396A20B6
MKSTPSKVTCGCSRTNMLIFVVGMVSLLSALSWNNLTRISRMIILPNHLTDEHTNTNISGKGQSYSKTSSYDDVTSSTRSCKPLTKFVFVKPEKTGGSTVSSLLLRFGMKNKLVAALKKLTIEDYLIRLDKKNHRLGILYYNCSDFPGYDYICLHIDMYDRLSLKRIIPNAKYFTIVRSPYTHLKSRFYYSRRGMNLAMSPDPFARYLSDLLEDIKVDKSLLHWTNSFSTRFGLDVYANKTSSLAALERLNGELDLVMLLEYFDESLVLLKKTMCWNFEDVIYNSCKVHTKYQPPINNQMRDIITELSPADIRLYNFFNNTFWRRVANYDSDFEADLAKLRSVQNAAKVRCQKDRDRDFCHRLQSDVAELNNKVYEEQMKWLC